MPEVYNGDDIRYITDLPVVDGYNFYGDELNWRGTLLKGNVAPNIQWDDDVWRSIRPSSLSLKITDDITGKSNTLTLNAPQDSVDKWSCDVKLPSVYKDKKRQFKTSLTQSGGIRL